MKFISALMPVVALADQIPIYGTYPGWVQGQGRTGIVVEVFMDLQCSVSAALNPTWNDTLETPWLDGTVADQVYWAYTTFPLPYHVHTFQVTQIVPYLMDLCIADSTQCLMNAYKDYSFAMLNIVQAMNSVSQDDFIYWWCGKVSEKFSLNKDTLLSLYTSADYNNYETNMNTRAMWKYAAGKGVSGTPDYFINGVRLDVFPASPADWVSILQEVYDSQY